MRAPLQFTSELSPAVNVVHLLCTSDSTVLTGIKTTSLACTRSQRKFQTCPTSFSEPLCMSLSLSHQLFQPLSQQDVAAPSVLPPRNQPLSDAEKAAAFTFSQLLSSACCHSLLQFLCTWFYSLNSHWKLKERFLDVPKHLLPLFLSKTRPSPSNWFPGKQRFRSCFLQAGHGLSIL